MMFEGKVSQALKFLDECSNDTVLQATLLNALIYGPLEPVSPAHFNRITVKQ